jgi:hypothetical protein
MTPKFCKKCRQLNDTGSCHHYKKCAAWTMWFRKEWAIIRANAKAIKKQNKE